MRRLTTHCNRPSRPPSPGRALSLARLLARATLCSAIACGAGVHANTANNTAAPHGADLRLFGQQWLGTALAQQSAATQGAGQPPLRLDVRVGELDPRLQLAPCARVEPFLPPGARLWGASRVGLRCAEGARWNIFLPVTVRAFGPAWLPTRPIAAGSALSESDFTVGEADWAAQPSPVVQSPAQWVGQVAALPLSPGQALRQNMLRPPQAFAAGATVRLLIEGPGFSVSGEGQAMSAGHVGQTVRVRTDNGRAIAGTVIDLRTVRVAL